MNTHSPVLCRLPPHGPLTASSFSRFFSAQVRSATTTIPRRRPRGELVYKGGEKKKSLYTVVSTHCTRTRAVTFWGLLETREDSFTQWDTNDVSGVCGAGRTYPAHTHTHTHLLCPFSRACVWRPLVHYSLFCSVYLNPTAFVFLFFLAWARIVNRFRRIQASLCAH